MSEKSKKRAVAADWLETLFKEEVTAEADHSKVQEMQYNAQILHHEKLKNGHVPSHYLPPHGYEGTLLPLVHLSGRAEAPSSV